MAALKRAEQLQLAPRAAARFLTALAIESTLFICCNSSTGHWSVSGRNSEYSPPYVLMVFKLVSLTYSQGRNGGGNNGVCPIFKPMKLGYKQNYVLVGGPEQTPCKKVGVAVLV